jgi:uncharacterized protein (DUF1800 family)
MGRREQQVEHLLRRAGFGGSSDDIDLYAELGVGATLDLLLNYEQVPDDVDARIGQVGHVGVTTRGQFMPRINITDARQRWLFRLVHSRRPLQEKLALFWHNHFATAYSKINGIYGDQEATRMLAAKPAEDPGGVRGQLELFRQYALGNFRDMLIAVAKDPAMLVWLDGRLNTNPAQPQENFAREVMELFTFGVDQVQEADVKAAARVFTGWNLRRPPGVGSTDPAYRWEYFFNAGTTQRPVHDTGAKTFTFDIYPGGGRTIQPNGEQEGIDFLTALCRHPETGPRLARKFYAYFVSEAQPAPQEFVDRVAGVYYATGYDIRLVVRAVLTSADFWDQSSYFARYSWPVEFVVRAIKETGWVGFSVDSALTPLQNMGQQLFEPPDVNGWELGQGWFSTATMLARMNFAATLTTNQRVNLRNEARPFAQTPQGVMSFVMERLSPATLDTVPYNELMTYLRAGTSWTGSDTELQAKVAGVMHLVMGSAYYQFV